MISVKNWKFHLSLFFDHLSRKLALLNYKNINFTKSRNCIFSKGVTHDFRQKRQISSMFFDSISLEIMSDDHLVKRRPPRLYKYGFHVVAVLNVFKVIKQSYDFRQKLKISLFVLSTKWALKKCWMIT